MARRHAGHGSVWYCCYGCEKEGDSPFWHKGGTRPPEEDMTKENARIKRCTLHEGGRE